MTAHPALDFLDQLDSSAEACFNIEQFSDCPPGQPKPQPDPLLYRYPSLTWAEFLEVLPRLEEANRRGAGVFVARNECIGLRSKTSISRIRGVHADLDGVSAAQLAALEARLPPSLIVQTSGPDNLHVYYQLATGESMTIPEAEAVNKVLVGFGADPAAVDASRLLRLPGFRHMKRAAEGHMPIVTLLRSGPSYTAEKIRLAFQPEPVGSSLPMQLLDLGAHALTTRAPATTVETIAAVVKAAHPALWRGDWANASRPDGSTGYPSASEADLALCGYIRRACGKASVPDEELRAVIEAVFNRSQLGSTVKWQSRADYRRRTIAKVLASNGIESQPPTGSIESHGDIRNARAFAAAARGRFFYASTQGRWFKWHGGRWVRCEHDEHMVLAKEVCEQLLRDATASFSVDAERGKRLIQDAIGSHKLQRIQAMVTLAISEPGMSKTDKELDADPYLLGVRNGVVDLRTGLLRENTPELGITRYCDAAFTGNSRCPRLNQFLYEVFDGDGATVEAVQRLIGCTLLGLPDEEILVICHGYGANGKSVFANVVHRIMADYAVTAPPTLLTSRRQGDTGPRNDLAAVAGARYVSINELQAGDQLDEQTVKMLAGREPITARFLHREFFEFLPIFTPWLRTNHKPIIKGDDNGVWRRLVLLPFTRRFSESERDPQLESKLLAERDEILGWMVEGARKYQTSGIAMSPRMRAELSTYRTESDLLGEFLDEHTVSGPDRRVMQTGLYNDYTQWCKNSGLRALTKKSFTQRLAERGFTEVKSGGDRYYQGLDARSMSWATQGGVGGI